MTTTREATEGLFRSASRTPFHIAPERAELLASDIFGVKKWKILPSDTEANFYALPTECAIYLAYAGMASLWCLAYAAFHIADVASRLQRDSKATRATHIDIGEYGAAMRIGEYLAYARSLCHADVTWPDNLETPKPDAPRQSVQGRINNVFFGALSWLMLHEIAHVHHTDELVIPADQRIRQEFRADNFATQWVLQDSGSGLKREFRVLMICVALAWLFLHESAKGKGPTHPPAMARFREASQQFDLGERSVGLENAYYVFKAFFDPMTDPPIVDTPRAAFDWVSERLGQVFGP